MGGRDCPIRALPGGVKSVKATPEIKVLEGRQM